MTISHETAMRSALQMAKQAPSAPFGAVLVNQRSGKMVARGVNRSQENPCWHGEIDVINRHAEDCANPDWQALTLYTTAEPCPMCMSAIAWAGISQVVYGTDIPKLTELGWNQLNLRASEVIAATPFREITLIGGVLQQECDRLFAQAHQLNANRKAARDAAQSNNSEDIDD